MTRLPRRAFNCGKSAYRRQERSSFFDGTGRLLKSKFYSQFSSSVFRNLGSSFLSWFACLQHFKIPISPPQLLPHPTFPLPPSSCINRHHPAILSKWQPYHQRTYLQRLQRSLDGARISGKFAFVGLWITKLIVGNKPQDIVKITVSKSSGANEEPQEYQVYKEVLCRQHLSSQQHSKEPSPRDRLNP